MSKHMWPHTYIHSHIFWSLQQDSSNSKELYSDSSTGPADQGSDSKQKKNKSMNGDEGSYRLPRV